MKKLLYVLLTISLFISCGPADPGDVPVIGYVDAFEDPTIAAAKKGWEQALKDGGFDIGKNIKVVYRNAQSNIPTLNQIISYFNQQQVTAIVSCPSIATIAAVQNSKEIPVFMMVSPEPALLQLQAGSNFQNHHLYGVGERLDYIDTSLNMIREWIRKDQPLRIGMLYNQSEPQSVEALNRIRPLAREWGMQVIAQPVISSADLQLVTQSLLDQHIDAFFANPDNTVFAGFEVILKNCKAKNIPIFTSEAGLVARGAVAAYGADLYQWGYQSGTLLVDYLKGERNPELLYEMVKVRNKVYNPDATRQYSIQVPSGFQSIFEKK